MAERPPSGRYGPALIIACGILSAAIVAAAFRLSGAIEGWEPQAVPTVIRPRGEAVEPPRASPALSAVGEDRLLLADGAGHLFLFEAAAEADAPGLVLHRVYRVRYDPSRHVDDPARRSPSGWYLDDLAAEREIRIEAIRARFEELVSSGEPTLDVVKSLEALGRDLLREGDVTYLTGKLDDPSYLARRSAGIALGEGGWRRAAPVLIDIAEKGDERSLRIVGPILERLTGIPAPSTGRPDEWKAATERWSAWYNQ